MRNFVALLFLVSHLNSSPIFSSAEDFSFGVRKINDHLYIGQKEPGLYFVMERIDDAVPDPSRLAFWQRYIRDEYNNHTEYKKKWINGSIPAKKGFLRFQGRDHNLTDGLASFKTSINEYHFNNELWIGYACAKDIQNAHEVTMDDIEMAVPIMTVKDAPMTTHMGISRSFHYMLKAIEAQSDRSSAQRIGIEKYVEIFKRPPPPEDKFNLHSNLAIDLHSFGAKVMKNRDESKLYMITAPVPTMQKIMAKSLPNHVYIGDNVTRAKEFYETSTQPLESKEMHIIIEALDKKIKALSDIVYDRKKWGDATWKQKSKPFAIRMEEKKEERSGLNIIYYAQKEKDIQEIVDQLPMDINAAPIKITGKRTQIFDQNRTHVVFDSDRELNIVRANGQEFTGDETKRFNWFYHPDMGFHSSSNPYATTDLEALASYLHLMAPTL